MNFIAAMIHVSLGDSVHRRAWEGNSLAGCKISQTKDPEYFVMHVAGCDNCDLNIKIEDVLADDWTVGPNR
jgi:hypothetical protein